MSTDDQIHVMQCEVFGNRKDVGKQGFLKMLPQLRPMILISVN